MPSSRFAGVLALITLSFVAAACGSSASGASPTEPDAATDDSLPSPGSSTDAGTTTAPDPLPSPDAGESLPACVESPACDGALPTTTKRPFKKSKPFGDARHRGRDALFATGTPQTLIGKFAYGTFDDDLKLEEVDVFVQRDCAGDWEKLGTATTSTDETPHATVDGVEDTGGRIYFDVPSDKQLPEGRHHVAMIVAGDGTSADLIVDVVPAGTRIVVSDVDGTLTSSETAEFFDGLSGTLPDAHPDAATVYGDLVQKGYRMVYLTARPETNLGRTRRFLNERGFPKGLVHTSTSALLPLVDSAAATFKSSDIAALVAHGANVFMGVGNTASDADAYEAAQIPTSGRIFYQYTDSAHGGRRIEAYSELVAEVTALAPVCK